METRISGFVDGYGHENDLLGPFVRQRRQQLCMTCDEAAKLAGLHVSKWVAIESGWHTELPDNIIFTIAGTLEVSADLVRLLTASIQ